VLGIKNSKNKYKKINKNMKVSKLIVPMVFLTATINNNNQVVASCESLCNDGFHAGIDKCTANSLP
jgi:hypothetical protein